MFRTFLEVAKERHFGRAAENLYITQVAVSARIKQLEGFFSTQLFQRERNNIKLTSAGERLVPYAEVMVNTLEQAKQDISLQSYQSIQLTLAGTPNLWDAYLQHALSVITDAFDGYAFNAETLSREQIHRGLLERTLDIGLVFDALKADELKCQQVTTLSLQLVSTEQQSLTEALEKRYVYVDWGTRFAQEHAERHPRIPPPWLRTSSGRIALDFILEKGGAAYLPQPLVEPLTGTGQLYLVEGASRWPRPVYLSFRKDAAALEAIQRVQSLIGDTEPSGAFSLQQLGNLTG
ncbi:LysR family transcriptional regulator [Ferrimonas lipolytica]|uniref:LysR family transcriptional regulator n=1 Tax=Ferrimonas lipolytica TaxID=2724191 RepID=UPI001EE9BE5E|nr:LysR family transcriptional regulator [Ferrimonas lipolytica]